MPDSRPSDAAKRLSRPEFIVLQAMLWATLAFTIDSMLPALPEIAGTLTPEAPNRAQLILTSFLLGMGCGTLIVGPISDAAGRKITITVGLCVYSLGAFLAHHAPTLESLLAARMLQGLGAAAPRIVAVALVRDLYEGRRMAQIMSIVMTVFVVMPAIAPFLGSVIIDAFGWRAIFLVFIGFALFVGTWLNLRQPETLPPERRRPLRVATLRAALAEVLGHRTVVLYILVLILGFGQMFALISTVQPIYEETYGRADSFPLWFMAAGILSTASMIANASLVMRVGMRRMAMVAYGAQTLLCAGLLLLLLTGGAAALPFGGFFAWKVSVFLMAGLTFGNLNALALQPLGHIAGLAASVVGAVSTVAAVVVAVPIGLAFDGTPVPLIAGTFVCSGLAWLLMRRSTDEAPAPQGA
jgi:DHA1 family bicyclomycin/chloramphenicol resistance-like MFS transporter